jgi:hypothetical protein
VAVASMMVSPMVFLGSVPLLAGHLEPIAGAQVRRSAHLAAAAG